MKSHQQNATTALTRREWIKLAASAGAMALSADALRAMPATAARPPGATAPGMPPKWTGHNRKLDDYYLAPHYPAYEPHPRYLGELYGSWQQIGRQYGERAGDLIRMVYEGWYRELLPVQGSPEVIAAYLRQQERYYEFLVPEALEMMHGIADDVSNQG